jgi:myo-inositol 2-dehydrogenase/D-chiro-inositol 1-dehydrogenase
MFEIALLGAGRIGKIHAVNATAHPGITLRYIVDPSDESATVLARESGAKVAAIEQVLSDSAISGIIVASSTDTHLEYCLRAAAAGKAIFCEKPLDLDLARVDRAAGELQGAKLFLGFNRRFDPHFSTLKSELQSGKVGGLETLHIVSHDPAPPPVSYVKVSGGLFKDMTIHDFDMARWLLGDEPNEVFAMASCLVDPAIAEVGDVDTAKILLKTASGKICLISNSRRSGYGYDQRIEAFGGLGALRAGNVMRDTVETWMADGASTSPFQNFFLDRYKEAYRREMEHFVDVLAGATPLVSFADGRAALAIAEAARRSVTSGKPEQISSRHF